MPTPHKDSWRRFVLTPEDVTFFNVVRTPEEIEEDKKYMNETLEFMFESISPIKRI
jgi:hypothetical protein